MLTVEDYARAFEAERGIAYQMIDALETQCGYALAPARYEPAARVLACPVKVHAPHWQHGRVLYAVARQALEGCAARVLVLDIGTAKGFSALCLRWALDDAGVAGDVVSVDVIDPCARLRRNSIADAKGPTTITELLAPWPEASGIRFLCATGAQWLARYDGRIRLAFVDGKHTYWAVHEEAVLLSARQQPGDVIVFDDVQIAGVAQAVEGLTGYDVQTLQPLPHRAYAVARKV